MTLRKLLQLDEHDLINKISNTKIPKNFNIILFHELDSIYIKLKLIMHQKLSSKYITKIWNDISESNKTYFIINHKLSIKLIKKEYEKIETNIPYHSKFFLFNLICEYQELNTTMIKKLILDKKIIFLKTYFKNIKFNKRKNICKKLNVDEIEFIFNEIINK